MLTEAQLVAARPVVARVAGRFKNVSAAEDLKQDALLRIWEKRGEFTGTEAEAMHWAGRVSRRVFINLALRREEEKAILQGFVERGGYCLDIIPTPEDALYAKELGALLGKFMARVAPGDRRRASEARRAALKAAA